MSNFLRFVLVSLSLWLALLWPLPTLAQSAQRVAADGPDAQLQAIDDALQQAQAQLPQAEADDALRALGDRVLDAQRQANALAAGLQPQLQQVRDRLGQLGEAADGEAAEIAQQRGDLQQQQSQVDAQVKRARLLGVEARQLSEQVERIRADQLSRQLSTRVDSPLSPALWQQVSAALPEDLRRFAALRAQANKTLKAAVAEHGWVAPAIGGVLAVLLLWPLRWLLRWLGRRYAAVHGPDSRLRRSGLALWRLLVGALLPAAAVWVALESLRGIDALTPALDAIAGELVRVTLVSALIASVVSALLTSQSSWRLLAVDDAISVRLRRYAQATAALVWISGVALLLGRAARASAAAGVALDGLLALCFTLLIVAMLVGLSRAQSLPAAEASGETGAASDKPAVSQRHGGVLNVVALLGYVVVAAALIGALLGYVHFALFASRQLLWAATVVATVGLLSMFVDDLVHWLFAPEGWLGRSLSAALGANAGLLQQVALVASAMLRLWLLLIGAGLLLAPYGTNLQGLLGWLGVGGQGLAIGGLSLRPVRLFQAIAVCVIGLALVFGFQRWLTRTYLPETELEPGTRASIATVTRYLGIAAVVLWTLAALDFDVKNLALLASALSVGIGFGLQAITQNFISGLILMAERPVKIGDRISIGDGEGDVRAINVRATEIQMDDKSTLIVPNSELITKSIRNRTQSRPPGRIQMQFGVPLGSDVGHVRELLLGVYAQHAGVLAEPAPSVVIDAVAGGQVSISGYAYCDSPRVVGSVRSELWFALLKALGEAGIALSSPQDVRIVDASSPQGSPPQAEQGQ
ncbi:MAG: DUF3772 domain-containing protein [Pseudoxanthomonas sp.]